MISKKYKKLVAIMLSLAVSAVELSPFDLVKAGRNASAATVEASKEDTQKKALSAELPKEQNEEETSSGTFAQFYSARNSTASRRPKLTVVYYPGPTQADSVYADSAYVKTGAKVKMNWSNIRSQGLSYVQYRAASYNCKTAAIINAAYRNYSESTKLGTKSSGSAYIDSTDWEEGCYRIYVRGVDKGGIKGKGLGCTVHIDGTSPVISSASITPKTSATSYTSKATPTISWNVSDTHFSGMAYSVDGGATFYGIKGSQTKGTFTIPSGRITTTGCYKIVLRAKDKAGNHTDKNLGNYYYDCSRPGWGSLSITPETASGSYTQSKTPVVSWSGINERAMSSIQMNIDDAGYEGIGTDKSGEYTIPSSVFDETARKTIKFRIKDSVGNYSREKTLYYYYYNPESPVSINIELKNSELANTDVLENKGTVNYIVNDPVGAFNEVTVQLRNNQTDEVKDLVSNSAVNEASIGIDTGSLESGSYTIVVTALVNGTKRIKGSKEIRVEKPESITQKDVKKRLGTGSNWGITSMTPKDRLKK